MRKIKVESYDFLSKLGSHSSGQSPGITFTVETLTSVITEVVRNIMRPPNQEIRREYKLSQTTRIDLWIDKLKSELWSRELPDIFIADEVEYKDEKEKRTIREIILNRLEDTYHAQVLNLEEPREILAKIKEIKRAEMNLNTAHMRKKFNELRLNKGEKAVSFLERMEEIMRFFEFIKNPIPLDQVIDQGINGTMNVYPTVRLRILSANQSSPVTTFVDFRNILLEEERAHPTVVEKPTALFSNEKRRDSQNRTQKVECYRCHKMGHIAKNCRTKKQKCSKCNKWAFHRAQECKKRTESKKDTYNKKYERNYKPKYREAKNERTDKRTDRRNGTEKGNDRDENTKPVANMARVVNEHEQGECCLQSNKNIKFICDTGATENMVKYENVLVNKQIVNTTILSANSEENANITVSMKGEIVTNKNKLILENVLYSPNLSENLLSLRKFVEKGYEVRLDDKKIEIRNRNGQVLKTGIYERPFWYMEFEVSENLPHGFLGASDHTYDLRKRKSEDNGKDKTKKLKVVKEVVEPVIENPEKEVLLDKRARVNENENLNKIQSEEKQVTEKVNVEIPVVKNQKINLRDRGLDEVMFKNELELGAREEIVYENENTKITTNNEETRDLRKDLGMLWHIRLGHLSLGYLKKLQKTMPEIKNVNFWK